VLIIRQEQINRLVMGSEKEFVEHLVGRVKDEHPAIESERDDKTLRKMVENGIERAKSHDLANAEDLTDFVLLMFDVAPNFDEQIQIKAVLDDERIPPDERIERARSPLVPAAAWEEAKNNYDENAWFSEPEKTE